MKLIVTTDGSTRPKNPGPMEVGGFIRTECGLPMGVFNKKIGHGTNNRAEYWAAFYGVQQAVKIGATHVELELDSKLVSNQLEGIYKIKCPELRKIKAAIMRELGEISLKVSWEKRNVGARPIADALSRGSIPHAERLIAELFPDEPKGGLIRWEGLPELEDIDLESLEEDFHRYDLIGD